MNSNSALKAIGRLIAVIISLGIIALVLYPVYVQPRQNDHRTTALSNIKQLGTSIIIYQSDNDDRFPHSTTMPGLRASIMPYCKNISLFQPNHQSTAAQFNFNYAGVVLSQKPLGSNEALEPNQTTVWYAQSIIKAKPGVFRAMTDGSVKHTLLEPLLDSLNYQFDRSKVTLAPADYLVNEDPLKDQPLQTRSGIK